VQLGKATLRLPHDCFVQVTPRYVDNIGGHLAGDQWKNQHGCDQLLPVAKHKTKGTHTFTLALDAKHNNLYFSDFKHGRSNLHLFTRCYIRFDRPDVLLAAKSKRQLGQLRVEVLRKQTRARGRAGDFKDR